MLTLHSGVTSRNCAGMTRRAALKAGFLGAAGLALPDYLRARAEQPQTETSDKSVILIWLDGGPSQLETFDPKPEAPAISRSLRRLQDCHPRSVRQLAHARGGQANQQGVAGAVAIPR